MKFVVKLSKKYLAQHFRPFDNNIIRKTLGLFFISCFLRFFKLFISGALFNARLSSHSP